MEITLTSIITIIFSSSLLASLLTFFGNQWLQRENYKKEYYKKLLEKRLDAYESVDFLIGRLGGMLQLEDGRICPLMFGSGEAFSIFLMKILEVVSKSTWLSSATSSKVTDLNCFLISEISNQIDNSKDENIQLLELGAQNRNKINELRSELKQLLYIDLKTLHDVKIFVKQKMKKEK